MIDSYSISQRKTHPTRDKPKWRGVTWSMKKTPYINNQARKMVMISQKSAAVFVEKMRYQVGIASI
jgi:hypothetical protein